MAKCFKGKLIGTVRTVGVLPLPGVWDAEGITVVFSQNET